MARFASWYQRYFLLINVPILLLITELVLVVTDPAHRGPFDLQLELDRAFRTEPAGDKPVVLLIGNSSVRMGIDAHQLDAALPGTRTFNFGLGSSRIDDARAVTELLLARGMRPALVVVGVNPFLIDDKINSDSRFPWNTRYGPYVLFHRSQLRKMFKRWFRGRNAGLDDLGLPASDVVLTEHQREEAVRPFLAEFANRPVSDFPLRAEVPQLLDWLAAQHIPTLVVIMPLSPLGTTQLSTYPALRDALAASVHGDVLDLADAYPLEKFLDAGHLNATGRRDLTARVAARIAEHHPELGAARK